MNTQDGRIYSAEMIEAMDEADRRHMRPMALDPTPKQLATGKVGRNDPCPCASGKKFKRCCLWRAESAKRTGATDGEELRQLEDQAEALRRKVLEASLA